MFSWNSLAFSVTQQMLAIWTPDSSAFSKCLLCAFSICIEDSGGEIGNNPFFSYVKTIAFFLTILTYSLDYPSLVYLFVLQSFNLNFILSDVGFSGGAVDHLPANLENVDSFSGLGRSSGVGNGNPLQYSWLENSMDRGAWWTTVHGFQRSRHNWKGMHDTSTHNQPN